LTLVGLVPVLELVRPGNSGTLSSCPVVLLGSCPGCSSGPWALAWRVRGLRGHIYMCDSFATVVHNVSPIAQMQTFILL
jgi:hypothetical protein